MSDRPTIPLRLQRAAAVPPLVLLLALAPPVAAQREAVQSRIDTTVALEKGGTVELSLVSGEIRVDSWDRNEVRVKAFTERGILRFDASASRVSLGVRSNRGEMGDTRYEVTIPEAAHLVARSVSGSISAQGGSDVDLHSVSGDIELRDAGGRTTIESISGTVHVAALRGPVEASTVSGDLELSDLTGDVEARTTSGDIVLRGVRSSYVRAETVSGDTRFAGAIDPKGTYRFRTHSGDIRLALPPVGATVSLQTFSGEVESEYPMTLTSTNRRERERMELTINGGGARVSAETFSGDITIERASSPRQED
ncbi:MAG: DUF4097 family beta strand repeat protein [Dactylosporangium sp.]|nr:DUF4097 family beta strand repeat protein [Dactylosporangium sp.]